MKTSITSLLLFLSAVAFCQAPPHISLNKIFKEYHFYPNRINKFVPMADGEHYAVLESDRSILTYDYKTGLNISTVLQGHELPDSMSSISDYSFCADESRILLTTAVNTLYRHSFEARFWIYDRVEKKAYPIDNGKQQLAIFSPDGKKVAYVKQNNLFYRDLITNTITQVTTDGSFNEIINGAPDWVYEEEFGFSRAFAWSEDSRSIAYYRFDESKVRQFDMMVYDDLYPSVDRFKYPKAGEANSIVSVHVFDIASGNTITMQTGTENDQYIVRIKWSAIPGKLAIIRLNRLQNKVDILLANAATGESYVIYHEENPKYLSRIGDDYITFLNDQKRFIILSEHAGYYHFYMHSINGELINPITKGEWEVTGLLGVDEKSNTLYFSSNQSSVLNRDVYSIRFDGTGQRKLSKLPGTNMAEFSSTFKYFVNTWSDANTPNRYTLHRIDGSEVRVLESNSYLANEIKVYGFAKKEFMKIPVSNDLELYAYVIKPPDFDSTKQYPLFICVYGGPQSQEVTNSWDIGMAWQQLIASKGIVVACVDNRGTDGRGEEFRKSTYLQLGKYETEDQINAARYLGNKSWIDENRIGIWGWSYGGYMALLCLTKGADVFKMGIAVAPVTNWRFYDNIYTERFMRRPEDNPVGYDENSPINYADKLKGKLLLIHGTADDNVHFQNSVAMAERLIRENKQFQQFMYPNKNHNINGGNTRSHLYTMMTEFILSNL